ncbi:TPA: hypothetical protein PW187_001758, partial [Enterococcus faecium]|nr:hypothetical protein [Enterococcus faecium]
MKLDMPGRYKLLRVRLFLIKLTNLRMYGSITDLYSKDIRLRMQRTLSKSKNVGHEIRDGRLAVYLSRVGKTCLIDSDESGNATKRFTEEIEQLAELNIR